jgi:deoxyadenosine/deoxycytidine kinase
MSTIVVYSLDTLIGHLKAIQASRSSLGISRKDLADILEFPDTDSAVKQRTLELVRYYCHPRIKWVSVEGVIGAGKSSLLAALFKADAFAHLRIEVFHVKEPVACWEHSGMLTAFYKNPAAEAATFQNYAFATRIGKLSEAYFVALDYVLQNDQHRAVILTERSPETDRDVFAYLQHKSGAISNLHYAAYLEQHRAWKMCINERRPDLYVWLDTPVSEAQTRFTRRARSGEIVPPEYSATLQQRHERLMGGADCCFYCGAPVLRVDGNTQFLSDAAALAKIGEQISGALAALFVAPAAHFHDDDYVAHGLSAAGAVNDVSSSSSSSSSAVL